MDQMDLPQVRLTRIARDPGAMLNRFPGMRIALDPESRNQLDRGLAVFAEMMTGIQTYRDDNWRCFFHKRGSFLRVRVLVHSFV